MFQFFHFITGDGLGFLIFMGTMFYFGAKRNGAARRHHRNQNSHNRLFYNDYTNNPYRQYGAPPPPVPPIAAPPTPGFTPPYNYGYPPPTAQGHNLPLTPIMPGTGYDPDQTGSWPQNPTSAWPEPTIVPPARVIQATPGNTANLNPNLPTKDIFVWGRSVTGWVYAGKLTIAKTLSEREIRQYADGKFGPELQDKLCIEADHFEQARYIFEQSRTF